LPIVVISHRNGTAWDLGVFRPVVPGSAAGPFGHDDVPGRTGRETREVSPCWHGLR